MEIRSVETGDLAWIRALLHARWGACRVVTRGRCFDADGLPGFVAVDEDQLVGLVTYHQEGEAVEIVSLDSLESGKRIGTHLVQAVVNEARANGCRRVWLITTNDNTGALRFYQKIGFDLAALHRHAIEPSRRLKPSIPEIGIDGIPIRHEIELEIALQ